MKKYHKLIFGLSYLIFLGVVIYSALSYNSLPETIPTHFGANGAPDAWAEKSLLTFAFLPFLHLLLLIFMTFIYRKPQYSNWPTSLALMTVKKDKREPIFGLIRQMIGATTLFISILFAYIQLIIILTALSQTIGISGYIIITILVALFGYLGYYGFKMYKLVKKLNKNST